MQEPITSQIIHIVSENIIYQVALIKYLDRLNCSPDLNPIEHFYRATWLHIQLLPVFLDDAGNLISKIRFDAKRLPTNFFESLKQQNFFMYTLHIKVSCLLESSQTIIIRAERNLQNCSELLITTDR